MKECYISDDGVTKVIYDTEKEEWYWSSKGSNTVNGPFETREHAAIDAGMEDFEFLYDDPVEES